MSPNGSNTRSSFNFLRRGPSKAYLQEPINMTRQRGSASAELSIMDAGALGGTQYGDHKNHVPREVDTPENSLSEKKTSPLMLPRKKEPTSDPFDEMAIVEAIDDVEEADGPTITVRAVMVGLIAGALGGAITQMFMYKPVHLKVDPLFIQLFCLILGRLLGLIPGPLWWNPGPVLMKETVFSSILASSAASGASAIEGLASERLFFKKELPFFASSLTLLSTQLVGYGLAGLLRPLLVYPAQITFPSVFPCAALFRSMSRQTRKTRAQLSFFKKSFLWISLYEILPTYIAPAFQALSPWCLTLPQVNAVTNLFGGSITGEGMGFLAVSADWMLVGHHGPMFVPLASQITEWTGYLLGIFLCMAAFRYNWFESRGLPFISYNMFDGTGKSYNLTEALHENGTANVEGIARLGLPYYPATMVLSKALLCMAVSSSISVALFYSFVSMKQQRKIGRSETPQEKTCPHRAVTKHLPDFPMFGYVIIFLLSVVMAVIATQVGHSGLSILGLFTALSLASVLCLALGYFEGTIGLTLRISPVVQMLGGIAFPGNVHENLWFTLYGSTTVSQCTLMLKDLKLGQYMHLAPRAVVIAQLGGTLLGAIVHYLVMVTILHSQFETLLLPHGSTWTGMVLSKMASEATSWGIFSRELYFHGKRYAIVPYFVIFGLIVPIPFLVLQRLRPASRLSLISPSLLISGMAHSMLGATSGRTMAALVGFTSQYVMRKYHFNWYKKYNYILCAALDGGTQLTILLIGFILQGGAGLEVKFPTYALNPEGPKDYCFMPEASGGGHTGHRGGHRSE